MDNKEWPKVRKAAVQQGWTLVSTKKGEQLRSPDGTGMVTLDQMHGSSDPHALDQTVRRMRKHGFVPPRKKGGR